MANDEEAQKARAESLRKQISRLTEDPSRDEKLQEDPGSRTPSNESPREFVERRMREVAKNKE